MAIEKLQSCGGQRIRASAHDHAEATEGARPTSREPLNLWDRLLRARDDVSVRLGAETISWGELAERAHGAARTLREWGVEGSTPVGCVLSNDPPACAGLFGVWLAGGLAVSLPGASAGSGTDAYPTLMVELCRRAGAGLLVARDEAAAALEPHLASHGIRVLPHSALAIRGPFVAELPGAQDPAFVQFSSGTTGRPRGAVLTTAAIEAQLERLAEAIELSSEDRGSMWLPLSHDMGLFGGLMLAWTHSLPFALSHPEQFLRAPRSWLEECREFGATVTAGPSFALDVACRAHTTGPPPRDLRLRACIVGGERVRMQTMSRAGSLLEQGGASARALTPAYGLAEATLAVTVSDLDEPPRALSVEASGLADARVVPAATPGAPQIACVGRPLRDVELDIDGGEIGEIVVRSPSQASGYVGDASATRARFSPQGVRTGDVGFLRHGELYVVGREDDLLIIGGRNLHAGVVESQLREHPAISGRACTVVDVADAHSSRLVAYVEPTPARHDWDLLTSTLRALARRSAGIQIREWVYLDVGSTPKTPSGKVNRFRMRQSGVVDGVRASRTVG